MFCTRHTKEIKCSVCSDLRWLPFIGGLWSVGAWPVHSPLFISPWSLSAHTAGLDIFFTEDMWKLKPQELDKKLGPLSMGRSMKLHVNTFAKGVLLLLLNGGGCLRRRCGSPAHEQVRDWDTRLLERTASCHAPPSKEPSQNFLVLFVLWQQPPQTLVTPAIP